MHLVSEAETLMGKRLVMDAVSVVIERVGQKVGVLPRLRSKRILMDLLTDFAVSAHSGRSDSHPV